MQMRFEQINLYGAECARRSGGGCNEFSCVLAE